MDEQERTMVCEIRRMKEERDWMVAHLTAQRKQLDEERFNKTL
jgi:hypothetical protein